MKKITATFLLSIPAFAMADNAPNVISENVKNTAYVTSVTVQMGQAWEGEKIVKRDDGSCAKITHSNLRIVELGNGVQGAHFNQTEASVACPT